MKVTIDLDLGEKFSSELLEKCKEEMGFHEQLSDILKLIFLKGFEKLSEEAIDENLEEEARQVIKDIESGKEETVNWDDVKDGI